MTLDDGSLRRVDRRRLISLRLDARLTTAELAERAGLAGRTVLDLERGRRDTAAALTVERLATALGCAAGDLMAMPAEAAGAASSPGSSRTTTRRAHPMFRRPFLPLLACALLLAGTALVGGLTEPDLPTVAVEDGALVAREARSDREVWRFEADGAVLWVLDTPWGEDLTLFGLLSESPGGGRTILANRRSGKVLWEFQPDPTAGIAAFPWAFKDSRQSRSSRDQMFLDLDGDGEQELASVFLHGRWYPCWVSFLDRHGRDLGTYLHRGHLCGPLTCDLDDDGRQEFLTGGTNNGKALRGATFTLLDLECHTGVSLDTVSGDTACFPDSARVRLVFPSFSEPWTSLLRTQRLVGRTLRVDRDPQGEPRIQAVIETDLGDPLLTLVLDRELRLLAIEPTDDLRRLASAWPAPHTGGGPADPEWLRGWLARTLRFEAGHYPPGPCERPATVPTGGAVDG